ncbi:MAG: class I SAM-dependent methyltransferase [Acidimicrobiales bacterium]
MRRPDPVARTVLDAYRSCGRRAAWHTELRWRTCPFAEVERLVPTEGDVLDLGCGHGHFAAYLARQAAGRRVHGVDVDAGKVSLGTDALARAGLADRVDLSIVDSGWVPSPGAYDAIVVADVLYLLGRERARIVLGALIDALRPGGTIVVKEMGSTPAWKARVNQAQERLAVGVLGITAGDEVAVLRERDIEGPMRAAGLVVTTHRLDRGYPHAHLAVVGERVEVPA